MVIFHTNLLNYQLLSDDSQSSAPIDITGFEEPHHDRTCAWWMCPNDESSSHVKGWNIMTWIKWNQLMLDFQPYIKLNYIQSIYHTWTHVNLSYYQAIYSPSDPRLLLPHHLLHLLLPPSRSSCMLSQGPGQGGKLRCYLGNIDFNLSRWRLHSSILKFCLFHGWWSIYGSSVTWVDGHTDGQPIIYIIIYR